MLRKTRTIASLALMVAFAIFVARVSAAPPTDHLVPSKTVGYMAVGDVDVLAKGWNGTQLAHLLEDPAMEPFAEDLRAQFRERLDAANRSLGISWSDIEQVPSGELAFALVAGLPGEPAMLMLADVEDNLPETDQLLQKIAQSLKKENARRQTRQIQGQSVVVYDIPARDGERPRRARTLAHFVKDNVLCLADRVEAVEAVLERWDGKHQDTLANLPAFEEVMRRCREHANDAEPQVRWFLKPLAFAEAIRTKRKLNPRSNPTDTEVDSAGPDVLEVMKHQGFEAIRGIGGHISFSVGRHEIMHRTAVWAPKPWEKSMRMLVFPNGGNLTPQRWVPDDVATYVTFHVDIMNAFDNFGPLFDELFGEGETGVWEDVLKSLKEDPNGPGIDLRADLVAHLGTRVTFFTDYRLPITPTSERFLFAVEATDAETLADTIRRSMETDPEVVRREVAGHVVWEIVEQEAPVPEDDLRLELELPGDTLGPAPETPEPEEENKRLLPNSAITVAHGHLLIASHVDMLREILEADPTSPSLADMVDYRLVTQEIEALGGRDVALRFFSRTDEAYRPTYELMRAGKMPESETMLGTVINAIMGQTEDEPLRKPAIDAKNLPEYDLVRRYLGPTGAYVVSLEDGWFIEGFLLSKHPVEP